MQNTVSVDRFDVVTNDFRHKSRKNMRGHGLKGIQHNNAKHCISWRIWCRNQRFLSQVSQKYESTWPKGYTNITMQNTASVDGFDVITSDFRHKSLRKYDSTWPKGYTNITGSNGWPTFCEISSIINNERGSPSNILLWIFLVHWSRPAVLKHCRSLRIRKIQSLAV